MSVLPTLTLVVDNSVLPPSLDIVANNNYLVFLLRTLLSRDDVRALTINGEVVFNLYTMSSWGERIRQRLLKKDIEANVEELFFQELVRGSSASILQIYSGDWHSALRTELLIDPSVDKVRMTQFTKS